MVILFMLLIWPSIQLYHVLSPKTEASDPLNMLYEVAQFQMNMLKGSIQEAKRYNSTETLQKVKLVAYSASFAHERLVRAVGAEKLPELPSISRFVEFITLLQLNGDRPLSDGEKELINAFADAIAKMYDSYSHAYHSSGQWVASKLDELKTLDQQISNVMNTYFSPK